MSDKITFKELVELIAAQSKKSQSSTNHFIHELVSVIEDGLSENSSVSLSGFGKFELRWMKERTGRHPQTGEEITIPGQNKVVFKPYKSLRESVNREFANISSRVLDSDETEESGASDPGTDSESVDELLIERDKPASTHRTGGSTKGAVPAAPTPDNLREVEKSGRMKWSYAAAAIIAAIAILVIIFLLRQNTFNRNSGDGAVTLMDQDRQEQVTEPSETDETGSADAVQPGGDPDDEAESGESGLSSSPQSENEPETETDSPSGADSDPQNEAEAAAGGDTGEQVRSGNETAQSGPATDPFETETYTVESGESLWSIAESSLGNPYLWPWIYHLNNNLLDNPNQIPAAGDLTIPDISDPENLSDQQREEVARGYLSVYEWSQTNNPDEARYFLWAVGVFSPDILEQSAPDVDPADLTFARQR